MTAGGLLDPRDTEGMIRRLAQLARIGTARLRAGDGGPAATTWHDMLFDGESLTDPAQADQALLTALAELQAGLADHLGVLPGRLHHQWLSEILGIARHAAVADVVPLAFVVDPKRAPVVVPVNHEVRAKDTTGTERRYATTEPLTLHGTALGTVRAYRARRNTLGAIADHAAEWAGGDAVFAPFAAAPGSPGVTPARHACRFADRLLTQEGRRDTATVTVWFTGANPSLLSSATWSYSTADGPVRAAAGPPVAATGGWTGVPLTITSACAPDPTSGEAEPWVEVAIPDPRTSLPAAPFQMSFTDVNLSVRVTGLAPDAAYYNDGKVDTGREFEPFGPVPRRGDAFYVRCDEAFAKPLARLGIQLDLVSDDPFSLVHATWFTGWTGHAGTPYWLDLQDYLGLDSGPKVEWQHRVAGRWQGFHDIEDELAGVAEKTVNTALPLDGFSTRAEHAGQQGHVVRAFLSRGDFGWEAHQQGLAEFAAAVANGDPVDDSALVPPQPPRVEHLGITYETERRRPAQVTATDGWSVRRWVPDSGAFAPFTVPASLGPGDPADGATLDFGLAVADIALGSSVSLYLDVDPADVGAAPGRSIWQVATATGWREAEVSDGTRGLRQSGLLRLVAPGDWSRGCADCGDPGGALRWVRLASSEPGRLGALQAVVPDSVEGVQIGRPDLVAPDQPLAPDQVKGLVTPVPGVKKVTNRAGRRGRSAETDDGYRRRAAGFVRHRDRVAQIWDYEELARVAVPELAAVRALPHTDADGEMHPGRVALVVVPAGAEPMPVPTVAMAERLEEALVPRMPVTARLEVVPPSYVPVTVTADVLLTRGVPALVGRAEITRALADWLHPARFQPPRFGQPLFVSSVVAFLESLAVVDHARTFALALDDGSVADPVEVDPARGLVASSGRHAINVEEQL